MINLLPLKDKTEIKKEYLTRLAVVLSISLSLSALTAIILLLPSFFVINIQEKSYEKQISFLEQRLSLSGTAGITPAIDDLNFKLNLLKDSQNDGQQTSEMIEKIISKMSSGIKIEAFFYDKKGKTADDAKIKIKGFSDTRKGLLKFIETLEAEEEFLTVESSVSNLLKENNIEFNLGIILNDKKI